MKIPVDQQFLKYSDQLIWHQQPWHIQNHLLPRSDLWFELQKIILTMSACIDALCCCHVIGGYLCYWTGAPKKVAGECICALNYSCQRMYVYLCNVLRAFKNFYDIFVHFVVWMVNCSVHLWETLIRRLNTPTFKGITDPKNKIMIFKLLHLYTGTKI